MKAFLEQLKKAWAWFVRIFEDKDGLPSSKRIAGIGLLIVALIFAFQKDADPIILGSLLGAGLACLGISSWSK